MGTLFGERVLQDSIWLDSTSGEPLAILGKVLMAKEQLAQAERTLQRAIYTAHYFLGQLYWEIGKADAAEREMKIATQIQQLQGQNAARPDSWVPRDVRASRQELRVPLR